MEYNFYYKYDYDLHVKYNNNGLIKLESYIILI